MLEFIQRYALEFILASVGAVIIAFFKTSFKGFKNNLEDTVKNIYAEMNTNLEQQLNERFSSYTEIDKEIKEELDTIKDQMNLLTKNVFAVEYEKLTFFYQRILDRGYVLTEELPKIEKIYESYRALGGNGAIQELHKAALKLPIKIQKEAGDK